MPLEQLLNQDEMAKHPLDISSFLGLDPKEISKPKKQFKPKPKHHNKAGQSFPDKQANLSQMEHQRDSEEAPRIEKQYWQQLNPESRRIFTSKMWKNVDFNPMLSELTDLSKLTEKWLRWAIPTYANGMKSGPIKEWFEGKQGDRDFHYVLVGEHLKHLKEVRQKRKDEHPPSDVEVVVENEIATEVSAPEAEPVVETPAPITEEPTQSSLTEVPEADESKEPEKVEETQTETPPSEELQMALSDLDNHIKWFQNYLDSNAVENDTEKS